MSTPLTLVSYATLADVTAAVAGGATVPDWAANKAYSAGNVVRATVAVASVGIEAGDILRRISAGTSEATLNATEAAAWQELGAQIVKSVATRSGDVVLAKADVGLANVDNTADSAKPISTAQQMALDAKAATTTLTAHTGSTSNPHAVTKAQVGLANVDNTSDAGKPVSTVQRTALDAKQATLVSGTNIRTVNGASVLGSGNVAVAADLPGGTPTTITDEGLDSGNATIDRATVPGETILRYATAGASTFKVPVDVTSVRVLVVAGGGGGGTGRYRGDADGRSGGGGGAGGLIASANFAVTAGASLSVSVGGGGAGATDADDTVAGVGGVNGGNSVFSTLTAIGGGHGGGHKASVGTGWDTAPGTGGSGGGASNGGTGAAGTAGQGFAGGTPTSGVKGGGGGGGAAAAGGSGTNTTQAAGGAGVANDITGVSLTYAVGGAGCDPNVNGHAGTAGTANRGNGGQGAFEGGSDGIAAGTALGGAGGSGVVVIRFPTQTRTYQALQAFASDSAAATGGLLVGQFYRDSTSGAVRQRTT